MPTLSGAAVEPVLRRARDGVCVIGPDGRIVFWNRAAERILGYSARDVIGRSCCDVFLGREQRCRRPCFPNCHVVSLARLAEPIQHVEMHTEKTSSEWAWLDVTIVPLRSTRDGAPTEIILLFRDVTATHELLTLIHERLARVDTGEANNVEPLSRRELEVLRLVATGLETRAIAERLRLSPATVRNHVQNVLAKLGAHNRPEAVAHATRRRLL
jgi:PAS domain S-box-containing protein